MIKLRQDEVNCPEFPWIEWIVVIFHIDQSVFRVLTVNLPTMVSRHSFPLILCKVDFQFLWLIYCTTFKTNYLNPNKAWTFWSWYWSVVLTCISSLMSETPSIPSTDPPHGLVSMSVMDAVPPSPCPSESVLKPPSWSDPSFLQVLLGYSGLPIFPRFCHNL